MFFLNEQKKLVIKCPSCQASFTWGRGSNCLSSCSAKKLEIEHQKVVSKMVKLFLGEKKIKVKFSLSLPAIILYTKGWGWTEDVKGIITIPWWTLRSKEYFFNTNLHEIGHITAYQKKFTFTERNILKKLFLLEEKLKNIAHEGNRDRFIAIGKKISIIIKRNREVIDRYQKWGDGHDYNPWYLEYQKLHNKLINSSFAEYAYGNTEPRSYGFDKHGKGEYDPQK